MRKPSTAEGPIIARAWILPTFLCVFIVEHTPHDSIKLCTNPASRLTLVLDTDFHTLHADLQNTGWGWLTCYPPVTRHLWSNNNNKITNNGSERLWSFNINVFTNLQVTSCKWVVCLPRDSGPGTIQRPLIQNPSCDKLISQSQEAYDTIKSRPFGNNS